MREAYRNPEMARKTGDSQAWSSCWISLQNNRVAPIMNFADLELGLGATLDVFDLCFLSPLAV